MARLNRHRHRPLTLISAPAGYGKTSLVVAACHELPHPTCWLSLEQSDRDVCSFVARLVTAIRQRHTQYRITRLAQCHVDSRICLRT